MRTGSPAHPRSEKLRKLRIYIAGRTALVHRHERLAHLLESMVDCEVFLPHLLVPDSVPKNRIPRAAFIRCVKHMKLADVVVADIEVYGKDTAWEIGYCHALAKPIIGYTENRRYESDFMVRGAVVHIARSPNELSSLLARVTKSGRGSG